MWGVSGFGRYCMGVFVLLDGVGFYCFVRMDIGLRVRGD